MNIGILLPGFSSDEQDWAIPVQQILVRELTKHHRVRVIALRYPHRRGHYRLYDADVYALGVGAWTHGAGRLRLWWDTYALLAALHRQERFDVLHAMWADETGLIAAWSGRMLHIPAVVSIAGGELANLPEEDYGLQRSRFGRFTVGQALQRASFVIAASQYAYRLIAQRGYLVPETSSAVVPLGVDASLFSPAPQALSPNHLIHVASLIPIKDQTMLLHAVAKVEKATLDIVGDGPLRPVLERLAADLAIAHRVRFVGAAAYPNMPQYFQQAALHILTSRHEGQGMVTLEAAACGLPTISTAVGIVPDYPELGRVVAVGDSEALAAAIGDLLDHPELRQQQATAARKLVEEEFTIQRTAQTLTHIYTELASH